MSIVTSPLIVQPDRNNWDPHLAHNSTYKSPVQRRVSSILVQKTIKATRFHPQNRIQKINITVLINVKPQLAQYCSCYTWNAFLHPARKEVRTANRSIV